MPILFPGKIWPGMSVRIRGEFINVSTEADDDPDSDSITLTLKNPGTGAETTYTYGEDAEIQKEATGIYTADVRPTEGGRWLYRWAATDLVGTVYIAAQGHFVVQDSTFSGWESSFGSDYS